MIADDDRMSVVITNTQLSIPEVADYTKTFPLENILLWLGDPIETVQPFLNKEIVPMEMDCLSDTAAQMLAQGMCDFEEGRTCRISAADLGLEEEG